jgi:DNA-binding MarR family transcriptional regulator
MSYEIAEDPEFDYLEYLRDDTKLSIIFSLDIYRSLNLRQIATILGISEPATHRHVSHLLDKGIIQLDPSMAGKRGKYYYLHPKIKPKIQEQEKSFVNKLKTVDVDFFKIQALVVRSLSMVTQRFADYLARYSEENAEQIIHKYEEAKQTGGHISKYVSFYSEYIKVANKEEEDELAEVFAAVVNKIEEINERNSNLTTEEAFELIYFSHLIVPLKRIDPRMS